MSLIDTLNPLSNNQKSIRIECEAATTVTIDELKELHQYKERTREHYQKFKTSVEKLGFSFPIFFWEDKMGTKWIVDAHGRKQFLQEMRAEGYMIPPLPAARIFAKDKVEAKKKILAQESHYGKIQEEPFYEFMNEQGFELDEAEVDTYAEIWEFDMEYNNTPEKDEEEMVAAPKKEECEECKSYHQNAHTPPVSQ